MSIAFAAAASTAHLSTHCRSGHLKLPIFLCGAHFFHRPPSTTLLLLLRCAAPPTLHSSSETPISSSNSAFNLLSALTAALRSAYRSAVGLCVYSSVYLRVGASRLVSSRPCSFLSISCFMMLFIFRVPLSFYAFFPFSSFLLPQFFCCFMC